MNHDPEAFKRALDDFVNVLSKIPDEDVPTARAALQIADGILMARATLSPRMVPSASPNLDSQPPATDDVPLKAEEAAKLLGVTKQWLYRNADKLPFAVRISRKQLRFWKAGALRWAAKRTPVARGAN